ncbi:hypothetical protein [Candidatus Viridilinea mediisalina]|uniref:Uncharacterized protein n=1 Tax=Candidatus Viridilinea mediisalina TaxID=2024553 RepID=A0A2A6RER4_9CHLR|nr:hypothetical protein [Candidatus Viridilinea mediisalina]PDW01502.1 hypothetical protein CJ255_18805 [Candidatus Viridilinea mediisalina]
MTTVVKDSEAVIVIPVDAATAQAYTSASPEDQLRMQLMLRFHLRAWITDSCRPLHAIMDDIGQTAKVRGLTPEILEEILREEGLVS